MLKEDLCLKTHVIKRNIFSSVFVWMKYFCFLKANSLAHCHQHMLCFMGSFYVHQDMPSLSLDLRPYYHFFFSIFPPGSVTRSHIFNYLKLNPILAFLQIYYFSLIFLNINICQSQILLASNLIRMHIFPFFPQPSH